MAEATTVSGRTDSLTPGARLSEMLAEMAHDFVLEWRRRFARPGSSPCAALEGETLILRMEHALTPAEVALGSRPAGEPAVRRTLEALLDDLYPWMAEQVESRLHCYVAESKVILDFEEESVVYRMALRDMPRMLLPGAQAQGCEGK